MNDFIDIQSLVAIVLKRWWLIVAFAVIGGLLGFALSQTQTPVYEATATVLVGQILNSSSLDRQDILTSELVAQTYADLILRQPVLQAVVDALELDLTWRQLRSRVSVELVNGTQLIQVTVQAFTPGGARTIADEVTHQLLNFNPAKTNSMENIAANSFVQDQIDSLQMRIKNGQAKLVELDRAMLETESADRLSELQDEANALEMLITTWENTHIQLLNYMQTGQSPNTLTIIEPAQSRSTPVSPQIKLIVIVGSGLGIFLALGIIVLQDYLNDTYSTPEGLTADTGLPVLGSISDMSKTAEGWFGIFVSEHPRSPITESFRLLRANIDFIRANQPLKTIMVTSCDKSVGKSTISANLANIIARNNRQTILLDSDLRKSSIHHMIGLRNDSGLTDILNGNIEIHKALQSIDGFNGKIITGGTSIANPSELMSSNRMDQVLENLKEEYDRIIIDSPPLFISEALMLSAKVDGVLLVVRLGNTTKKSVRATLEQLARAGAKVIGVVLNGAPEKGFEYYGAYMNPNKLDLSAFSFSNPGALLKEAIMKTARKKMEDDKDLLQLRARTRQSTQPSDLNSSQTNLDIDQISLEFLESLEKLTEARLATSQGPAAPAPSEIKTSSNPPPAKSKHNTNGAKPAVVERTGDSCPNEDCPDFGALQSQSQNNIVKAGKSNKGAQRYRCKTCGKSYTDTQSPAIDRSSLPGHEILETFALIAQGNPINLLAIKKGYRKDMIVQWIEEASDDMDNVNEALVSDYKISRSQLDALWTSIDVQSHHSEPIDHVVTSKN